MSPEPDSRPELISKVRSFVNHPRAEIPSILTVLEGDHPRPEDALQITQELIEVLPIPVFYKARDGRYLGVNQAWEDFFSVSRRHIVGSLVADLYPDSPAVAARHKTMDDELWANPGNQSYEVSLRTRDGRLRHTIYYKATFRGPDGRVAGLIGTIIDITERVRSEQRQAIEHSVGALLGHAQTVAEAITGIIEEMCRRFGWACGARWSLDERENRLHCIEYWAEEDAAILKYLQTSSTSTFVPGHAGIIRRTLTTGAPVWVEDLGTKADFLRAKLAAEAGLNGAFALPIALGERILGAIEFYSREPRPTDPWLLELSIGVGRQIGMLMARREAEEELRRAHAELEAKVRELARSNEELQQFAYVASHDLQEPLRMVSSYTQLLGRRYASHLDSDAREFMGYIVEGSARMKQLIEDLLAYSRVGTRVREFRDVSSEAALEKALANLRGAQERTNAAVSHDALPAVHADEGQLIQLFQNLVGNAIKFRGTEEPRIHVSARAQDGAWLFSVADNGIGLDPEYAERIFLMFQRLHNREEYPGTGIGLAICKKIVDRHGGRIWVDGRPGNGCTFFFTLPMKEGTHAH
jgi:PAS domain S-box-containing protein